MIESTDWAISWPRKILLLVTGLSPQIVTETVYALAVKQTPIWVPTEVHVLTTFEGRERARKELFSNGWFERLRQDYDLPPIAFGIDHLHTIRDAEGAALDDIRDQADSQAAGDALARMVARFTTADSALHMSIAGGRKTMGFLAGYTLSLLGRSQDRLSHVLVSSGFESLPGFFYPTTYSQIIHTHPPENRPLDTRDADVSLAEIPFVRLRAYLDDKKLHQEPVYARLVHAAQVALGMPRLEIDLENRLLRADGQVIKLPLAAFALYAWVAKRKRDGLPGVHCPSKDLPPDRALAHDLIQNCGDILPVREYDTLAMKGLSHEQFTQWRSRLHRRLNEQLGRSAASRYRIAAHRRGGEYELPELSREQIQFTEIDT